MINLILTILQLAQIMYKQLNCVADFPLIPQQAFLFKPLLAQDQDQPDDFKRYEGSKFKRLLYEGWAQKSYMPHERSKLRQFQTFLEQKKLVLDSCWDQPWRLRWLQSTNYNFDKTVEDMKRFESYMHRVKELSFTHKIAEHLKNGLFYMVGRDSHYRPIVVFDAEKIIQADLSEEECQETQMYFFEYIMKNFFIPGQVESWVALIDSNYQSMMSLMGNIKSSFIFLADTYRNRLYKCFNCRINLPLRMIWSVVQKFLDEETVNKIFLYEDLKPVQLYEFTNLSQFEVKFGGTLPDLKPGEFWPPRCEVSTNYKVEKENTYLMTRQEYTQNYETHRLFQTKIHEQLLIKKEPTEIRDNKQKKTIKKLQKQFERRFENLEEQELDLNKAVHLMESIATQISYFSLLESDKKYYEKQS